MPEAEAAVFVAALNDALDLRRLSPELEARDWLTSAAELLDTPLHGIGSSLQPSELQHDRASARLT